MQGWLYIAVGFIAHHPVPIGLGLGSLTAGRHVVRLLAMVMTGLGALALTLWGLHLPTAKWARVAPVRDVCSTPFMSPPQRCGQRGRRFASW